MKRNFSFNVNKNKHITMKIISSTRKGEEKEKVT